MAGKKGVQDMKKAFLKIAALATAGIAASGCSYDMGLGYASDGYGSGYYDCDPYNQFDTYYDCDNGYGFSSIGYGGGWYDNYWYPGYGYFLFDNYGRRYNMRDNHRRYWGKKRYSWYRENRDRNRDGGRYDGRGRDYTDNATPGTIGWPERNGGRSIESEGRREGRGDGRRRRGDQWHGGNGHGADAVRIPNPEVVQGRGRGNGEGYGRRQRGEGQGSSGGEGRGYRRSPLQQSTGESSGKSEAPAYRPAPAPDGNGPRQQVPRIRSRQGAVEQPQ